MNQDQMRPDTGPRDGYIDCSREMTLPREVSAEHGWWGKDISDEDWLITLDRALLQEIRDIGAFLMENPLGSLQRTVDQVRMPLLRQLVADMKMRLDEGRGFAVLHRLPVDDLPIEVLVEVFWLVGQLVGPPVAQRWSGEMLYEVRDTGQRYQYGVRGSHTAVELVFHTDNAFARRVPDYVGLLCRRPAMRGGVSRFCSLYTVYHRMQSVDASALMRLHRPMFFDRQGEHAPRAPRVCWAPYFSWRGERLFARANSSLVRKGYEVAECEMDRELHLALEILDQICSDSAIWYEAPLECGQIQYINNHEIGHYRSAFEG